MLVQKNFKAIDYLEMKIVRFWEEAIASCNLVQTFKRYKVTDKHKLKRFVKEIQAHMLSSYFGLY